MNVIRPMQTTVTFEETGYTVPLFQLIQWKHALHLEVKTGRAFSSKGSVSALVKRVMNLPKSARRQRVYEVLCQIIDDVTGGA